jgi:transposase-like protein
MEKVPRCKKCVKTYSRGGKYHVGLKSMFIRKRNGKIAWIKVGYWCQECKRFYNLTIENEAIKNDRKKD